MYLFIFFFFFFLIKIFNKMINFSENKIISLVFLFILMFNYFSLLPFSLSVSSLIFNLMMSFFFWSFFFIFFFFINYFKNSVMFLPVGTPYALVFFLILIEMISILMRPISLGVRLMSNLTASHLMMHLMFLSIMKFKLVFFFSFFFIMFEFFVALIQSYIFSVLLTIYYKELI